MANKITQLVNKDGDNLYPLAGGILSDSVTTDMVQDGAVTSDKIDSTTLFTSPSGQGLGTFTLSDSIQNYRTIEIEFRDNDGDQGLVSFRVIAGSNKVILSTFQPGYSTDRAYYTKSALCTFTGADAAIDACKEGGLLNGQAPSVGTDSSTLIKIYSIVGYK